MKLHLPKLLRNAVLACITAVAGISTTVGTAAITGGVVAFILSAQQAVADWSTDPADTYLYTGETTVDMSNPSVTQDYYWFRVGFDSEENPVQQGNVETFKALAGKILKMGGSMTGNHKLTSDFVIQELQLVGDAATTTVLIDSGNAVTINGITTPTGSVVNFELTGGAGITFGGTSSAINEMRLVSGDSWNRNVTIKALTTVTMNNFQNSWGLGTMTVDGRLEVDTLFKMHTGANGDKTRNLVTGSGVINVAALQCSNNGTYNFSVNEFIVEGNAQFGGAGVNILGGTMSLEKGITSGGAPVEVTGGTLKLLSGNSAVNKLTIGQGGVVQVASGAAITLNSTVYLKGNGSLENNSDTAVTFGSGFQLDLSEATGVTSGNRDVAYTIISGSGNKSLEGLTQEKIVGSDSVMGTWTIDSETGVVNLHKGLELVHSGGNLSWNPTGTTIGGVVFENNIDSVTITGSSNVTVGDVSVKDLTISGAGTEVVLTNGNYIASDGLITVGTGATLELTANNNSGSQGVLRGEVVVEDGATLRFNVKDATGWNSNMTRVISVLAGGTLEMRHTQNETFGGILNLAGTMKGTTEGDTCTKWDLHGGSATINVAVGASAKMKDVNLNLRQDKAVVTVGSGATLDISRSVTIGDKAHDALIKKGEGAMTVGGASSLGSLFVQGGSVAFGSSLQVGVDRNAPATNGSLEIAKGAELSVAGDVTLKGTIKNYGSLDIAGDINLTTLDNLGFKISVATGTTSGVGSYTKEHVWYMGDGSIAEGSTQQVTYNGASYGINDTIAGGTAEAYIVADEVVVGGDTPTSGTESASLFALTDAGTLKLAGNANDTLTVSRILDTTVGGGTIEISSNLGEVRDVSSVAVGKLKLTGASDESHAALNFKTGVDMSSFTSTELSHATIKFDSNADATLNNVSSVAGNNFIDVSNCNHLTLKGITNIAEGSELRVMEYFTCELNIQELAGAGTLNLDAQFSVKSYDWAALYADVTVGENFTGTIKSSGSAAYHTLRIKENATFSDAQFVHSDNVLFTLAGSGIYNLTPALDKKAVFSKQVELGDEWTGSVRLGGTVTENGVGTAYVMKDSANEDDLNGLDSLVTENSSVMLNGVRGWVAANANPGETHTVSADLVLKNLTDTVKALVLHDGFTYNNNWGVFAGDISGDGDIEVSQDRNVAYKFTGDISGWTGSFTSTDADKTTRIMLDGDATVVKAAITRAHASDANGIINLTVNNQAAFYNTVNVTDLALGPNAGITLQEGSELSVVNGITLAAGQNFSVQTETLVSSSMNIQGGTLTLGSALNLDNHNLTLNSDSKATLVLADGFVPESYETLSLITGINTLNLTLTAETTLADLFNVNDSALGAQKVTLADGKLVLTQETVTIPDLYWEGGTGTWNSTSWSTEDGVTTNLCGFTANADAIFSGSASTITVDTNATVGTMTVSGAAYTFNRKDGTECSITASGLVIGENASATFGAGALNIAELGSVSVAADGVLDLDALGSGALNPIMKVATGDGTIELTGHSGDPKQAMIDLSESSLTTGANYKITGHIAVGHASNDVSGKTFTISKTLSMETGCIRVQNGATIVIADGATLTATSTNNGGIQLGSDAQDAGAASAGHLLIQGGNVSLHEIKLSGNQTKANGNSFTMTGGTLTWTSAGTLQDTITSKITGGTLKVDANNWTIKGAEIGGSTAGAVTIETGTGTITLNNVNLTSALTNNNGNLALSGTINIVDTAESAWNPEEVAGTTIFKDGAGTEGNNGFRHTSKDYTILTSTSTGTTTATGVTWQLNGAAIDSASSFADGVLNVVAAADADKAFWVNSGTVNYGSIGTEGQEGYMAGTDTTGAATLKLNGGTLALNKALVETTEGFITVNTASTIQMAAGVTLSKTSITGQTATNKVTMQGEDATAVFNMGSDVNVTGLDFTTSDWKGTVTIEDATNDTIADGNSRDLGNFGNAESRISINGLTGWIERSAGVAAHIILGEKGITLTDNSGDGSDYNNKNYIYTGGVSGTGDFTLATVSANAPVFEFSGNMSGWEGGFVINQSAESTSAPNVTLKMAGGGSLFKAATAESAAGKGIELNRAGTLNVTIGTTTEATTMNGGIANTAGGTINLTTEGTTTLAGALRNTGTGAFNLINNGTLSLANDTTLSSLTNSGSLTATGKSIAVTGAVTGTGSITSGALTLRAASNTVGDLTLTGALTLGTAEAASSLTATGELSIGGGVLVNKLADSLISAGSLTGGLTFNVGEDLLTELASGETKKLTLLTLTTALDETSAAGVLLGALTETGTAAGVQTSADGRYDYTLAWNDTYTELTLEAVAAAGTVKWEGDTDGAWATADNWNGGLPAADSNVVIDTAVPTLNSRIAVEGETQISNLTVEGWEVTSAPYAIGSVTGAGSLDIANNLAVNSGSLALMLDTEVGKQITVGTTGTLAIEAMSADAPVRATAATVANKGQVLINENTSLAVGGAVTNSGTLQSAGTLTVGTTETPAGVTNTGILAVTGGTTTITGAVDNDDRIEVTGGSLSTGAVDNDGTITISGGLADDGETPLASVTVNGDLDNTNGTITIGSAAVADNPDTEAAATYGSLKVTGDLTGTGATDKLTVAAGSSLTVDGDLTAADVALEFGGDVTVGGTATVGDLTIAENASFAAANATIGEVDNDGTLTVGTVDATTGELVGGTLSIDSLSGSGDVTVGKDGTLNIGAMTEFSGQLLGEGKLSTGTEGFVLETLQNTVKDSATATDIAADSLTVSGRWMKDGEVVGADTEGAVWDSANGSILGDVATNSIVIDVLDTAASPHLTLNSLTGKLNDTDTDTTVEITLAELGSSEGVQDLIAAGEKTYHLLHIAGTTTDLKLTDNLSDADEQLLWKSGLKLSDLQSTSPMALRTAGTDVSISVLEQTLAEATWDTAGDTTKIGLDLGTLTNGTMVLHSNDMLDNVKSVKVTADTELDLSGSDDTAAVNIQGLTGEKNLTISGNGDTVNVTTAVKQDDDTILAGKYDGGLVLSDVAASVSGQYGSSDSALGSGTLEKNGVLVGKDATAKLDVKDSLVVLDGGSLSGDSAMDGGALAVKSTNAAIVEGNIMVDTGDKLSIKNGTLIAIVGEATDSLVLDVQGTGKHVIADLGTVDGAAGDVAIVDAQNKSIAVMDKYFSGVRLENGKVVADRNTSYYSDKADESMSANGAAGMQLADAAMVALNPQATAPQGDLAGVLNMLDTATGAAADELGASLAGASTAVLGMATMGDVDRQLQAIRNRTTTMGVDQSVANEDMPYFNAWINAEGDRSELSESGTESGYELSSWGGTVGFDVDLCPTFTAGMALTAMYGDIDTTGADKASGNIDTYYVSAFARYCASAWTHTFVATVGMSDISLDRHVAGAEVEGETDGLSFGLMYEVGRVFALTEDGSTCLQPVFNVTWKHTAIDAYTEDGSDLALEVDEQTLDTVTFGLGARLQTVVGESMYNRTSILEARVLAKADVGDRSGSSDVALSALPGAKASVDSAEMGAFGLEAGAGLTIPVGDEGGSIFMDASVELRSDYTNVNGTVGYRINF